MLPKQRMTDLHVEHVDGETVIYDQRTNAAHCLNPVAAHVWEQIDASDSMTALVASVRSIIGPIADEAAVEQAVNELRAAELLEDRPGTTSAVGRPGGISRRSAAMAAMAAGVALAFVTTVTAPAAAQTASGGPVPA